MLFEVVVFVEMLFKVVVFRHMCAERERERQTDVCGRHMLVWEVSNTWRETDLCARMHICVGRDVCAGVGTHVCGET